MSARVLTFAVCDSCGRDDVAVEGSNESAAIEEAQTCGWQYVDGRDLCPACATLAEHPAGGFILAKLGGA